MTLTLDRRSFLAAGASAVCLAPCALGARPRVWRDPVVATLQAKALRYFLDHAHPSTGLVRDRARNFSATPGSNRMASLAATGFGLATVTHAAVAGRLSRSEALSYARRAIAFVNTLDHYHGWFYHFVDWETGARFARCEVSTVDTAWFFGGALYAAGMLGDPALARAVDGLYRRLDFYDLLTDGGAKPDKLTLSMGYVPESGYIKAQWDSYAEQQLLLILGLGHPERPLPPAVWRVVKQPSSTLPDGNGLVGATLSLFTHQYSQLFLDLRGFDDGTIDYVRNSVVATTHDRATCAAAAAQYQTYAAGYWGLSACDGPDGYQAYSPAFNDGTVCLGAAGASAQFLPDVVVPALATWAGGTRGSQLLGQYGFLDGLNLDRKFVGFVDADVIGITIGALYLSLANLEERTAVRPAFTALAPIAAGLARASVPSADEGDDGLRRR